jgi:prepilin-type N-terminal cleavage/methylation domain-containing protein
MSIHRLPELTQPCWQRQRPAAHGPRQRGFTLVELLIVITIIGILIGLLIPAVGMVQRSVQRAAIAAEVLAISNAIEQYKNKYGEYPPDGSSRAVFERHCRKVWANMAPTELAWLSNRSVSNCMATVAMGSNDHAVMDPAEALVFFLGGFSKDPNHPFTGPGGPLFVGPNNVVQYNVDRNEPIFEFKQSQLSLDVINGITISIDERDLFGVSDPALMDCLPVYSPGGGRKAPFVYFDSRTYRIAVPGGAQFFNAYAPAVPDMGVARPYKSTELNTTVQRTNIPETQDRHFRYVNDRSFQLISAGLDDSYGGIPTPGSPPNNFYAPPTFFIFPTGQQLVLGSGPVTATARYFETGGIPSAQLDNATNFSEGVLENSLE